MLCENPKLHWDRNWTQRSSCAAMRMHVPNIPEKEESKRWVVYNASEILKIKLNRNRQNRQNAGCAAQTHRSSWTLVQLPPPRWSWWRDRLQTWRTISINRANPAADPATNSAAQQLNQMRWAAGQSRTKGIWATQKQKRIDHLGEMMSHIFYLVSTNTRRSERDVGLVERRPDLGGMGIRLASIS